MASKPLVIYHKNCVDGFSAAWCFWHRFKNTFEYFPASYTDKELPDVENRNVYMVDFSYKKPDLDLLSHDARKIWILDHHKTAIDNLSPWLYENVQYIFDLNKSGAMLAWEFLNGEIEPPQLIKYVQDRDLWTKKLPFVDQVSMAVFARNYDFYIYDDLMLNKKIEELIADGEAILMKFNKDLEELLTQVVRMGYIAGHKVPIANLPYMYASEGATRLAKGFPFAATYYDTETSRVFSLRSTPEGMDVSKIAAMYNGGGHQHASGFKVPRDHVLSIN